MRVLAFVFACFALGCQSNDSIQQSSPVDFVNPFVGTGGHGHTFPGATLPFGMVQLSPDTRLTGWDGCSAYHYTDSVVYGFSHTHLSGTGVSDYGDVLLMPGRGQVHFSNDLDGYASTFDKQTEIANPGYYKSVLTPHDISVELTATMRTGIHRYVYDTSSGSPNVVLDLYHRDMLDAAQIQVVDSNTVVGFRISDAWAKEQHIYFAMQFSEPIAEVKTETSRPYIAGFVFAQNVDTLLIRVGISAVDVEGAKKNLISEADHWDFDKIQKNARDLWDSALSKIEVYHPDSERLKIFYTALYHTMIAPNLFSDADGRYRGMDLNVHKAEDRNHYTVFSLWDTYRATHPLFTIIEQKRTIDFIRTFLSQYDEGGIIPIWELAGNYTGCMIGYHAIPVIADAYLKGIDDFDKNKALHAMVHSADQDHLGLESYKKKGYVSAGAESESVSKTLEYAFDDWCIAEMASTLGDESVARRFYKRAANYVNLFDPKTGFFRPKLNGTWVEPFAPEEVNFHFTEANAWQYRFYAPQDVKGMTDLLGGNEALEKALDDMFTASSMTSGRKQSDITGLIGQYAHGNEPSHHMAYLYNYAGRPDKTQERVHEICSTLYSNEPDGLSGNEDCGQMSAWYVFSMMGFYPVTPCADYYLIGSPGLERATINLENGNQFEIICHNLEPGHKYVQSVKLNGVPLNNGLIRHSTIMKGGKLEFEMAPTPPEQSVFETPVMEDRSTIDQFVACPFLDGASIAFLDSQSIELKHINEDAGLFYALDSDLEKGFIRYTSPVTIQQDETLRFYALQDGVSSQIVHSTFRKIRENRKVTLATGYAPQYAAGGDEALVDYLHGSLDFRVGFWQGYEGVDLEAIVDLGEIKPIEKIALQCLQDQNSWIFMPDYVDIYIAQDRVNWEKLGRIRNSTDERFEESIIEQFSILTKRTARFVKISAKNKEIVPSWHLGAGGKSWLFADEIIIE